MLNKSKHNSMLLQWSISKRKHTLILGVLCLFIAVHAQLRPKQLRNEIINSQIVPLKPSIKAKKSSTSSFNTTKKPIATVVNPIKNTNTLVYLENSETLSFDKFLRPDVQVLNGSVRFRHDNALLYCDSAYFYEKANSLDAFGNVRIVQGDTLFIYGDLLYYDGNSKLAKMRHNVRMVNRKTRLTTDSLNYDRNTNLAYYFTGGKIVDEVNTLTSVWGQYSTSTSDALFRKKVHLVNKDYTMDSDTLKYNTKTHIANILGPTHILYNKETNIYTNRGWYNTSTQRMMLLDRSLIKQKSGKTMVADTIFYDSKLKFGEGFKWVVLNDTVQKSTLVGNYVYYNDSTDIGLATDSAILVDWSSKDTMYVHADTLYTSKDSIYDVVRGNYNVRIFRNDIQGISDSLAYSARDSIINMHGSPVLWSDNNQLSGEFIQAFTKNQKVDYVHIQRAAMAVQKEDSIYFNQLSGKEIIAYIDSGQLYKVNVNGNAETIYYPKDEKDSTLIGLNKTESSYVVMYLKNKKVERIIMTSASSGTMYPLNQLSGKDLYLKNFLWIDKERPKKKEDILTIYPKLKKTKTEMFENKIDATSIKQSNNLKDNTQVDVSKKSNNLQESKKPDSTSKQKMATSNIL